MSGLEDLLHAGDHAFAEPREFGPAMIDGRQTDRAQDPVRHRARPGNLQEMSAAGVLVEGDHRSSDRPPVLHAKRACQAALPPCLPAMTARSLRQESTVMAQT